MSDTVAQPKRDSYWTLLVFIALVFVTAGIGGAFPPDDWYAGLQKPWFNPPNWVFPVAWSILFLMIGIAGWLVYRVSGVNNALVVWGIGLPVNALWTYLFFGLRRIDLAFYELLVLWVLIVAFAILAWRYSRLASLLFIPYIAWVTFAGVLTWSVWDLNPAF